MATDWVLVAGSEQPEHLLFHKMPDCELSALAAEQHMSGQNIAGQIPDAGSSVRAARAPDI